MNFKKTLIASVSLLALLSSCGETLSDSADGGSTSGFDQINSQGTASSSSSVASSKERKPEILALQNSLNRVFASENQRWETLSLFGDLCIGLAGSLNPETSSVDPDSSMRAVVNATSLGLACNGTTAKDPSGLSSELSVSGLLVSLGTKENTPEALFKTTDSSGKEVEDPQFVKAYLTGYNAYYDLAEGQGLLGLLNSMLPGTFNSNGYDASSWSMPSQGHYAIDGDLKTKYTNDIFPMLGQYLPQLGTMEVTMLEMAYEANPSDFLVTNDNGHYTFTADTTSVAHLYSNIQSILNSLGTDVLITKDQLPMLSEDLTVDGALKWVKAVTDSMTINKLKVTFDYTATVFNKVDVDIDVVWDEAKIKTDLAAMGDSASWPLAFKLSTSASAKTGDEAKITLPDFTGYTDFVMPPKKTVA
jgi:hypothetical protein